jgi:hypothetical protein
MSITTATDRRLRGSLLATIRSEVSTYSPSGHFSMCPQRPIFFTRTYFVQMYRPYAYFPTTVLGSPRAKMLCLT